MFPFVHRIHYLSGLLRFVHNSPKTSPSSSTLASLATGITRSRSQGEPDQGDADGTVRCRRLRINIIIERSHHQDERRPNQPGISDKSGFTRPNDPIRGHLDMGLRRERSGLNDDDKLNDD